MIINLALAEERYFVNNLNLKPKCSTHQALAPFSKRYDYHSYIFESADLKHFLS